MPRHKKYLIFTVLIVLFMYRLPTQHGGIMKSQFYIRQSELMELLRTAKSNLVDTWYKHGLRADGYDAATRGHPLYLHDKINSILLEHASNTSPLPTVAELLARQEATGNHAFLRTDEVAAQIGESEEIVRYLISQGVLLATRMVKGGAWLVLASEVAAYLDLLSNVIPATLAAHCIGHYGDSRVIDRLSTGDNAPLVRIRVPGRAMMHVTRSSFMTYLDEHVNKGTGEEWWHMRSELGFPPLLTVDAVRRQCQVAPATIKAGAVAELLWAVDLGAGHNPRLLIAPHSVPGWLATIRKTPKRPPDEE
jgi:hypothetical protein